MSTSLHQAMLYPELYPQTLYYFEIKGSQSLKNCPWHLPSSGLWPSSSFAYLFPIPSMITSLNIKSLPTTLHLKSPLRPTFTPILTLGRLRQEDQSSKPTCYEGFETIPFGISKSTIKQMKQKNYFSNPPGKSPSTTLSDHPIRNEKRQDQKTKPW